MRGPNLEIRPERAGEATAVRIVHDLAFGQSEEGKIVDALRRNGAARLSLVATTDGKIVGHIVYSPITIAGRLEGAALGPMAVRPERQGNGIGAALVRAGNAALEGEGCPFIIVLGHPEYYPRFGFRPASEHRVSCQWAVPDEVFMLLVLDQARMAGVSGEARYRPEFSSDERDAGVSP